MVFDKAVYIVAIKANQGFTLIESLVIIAIIAIPAAFLPPIFSRNKKSTRSSVYKSNLANMPQGAGVGAAAQHSQSLEAWFMSRGAMYRDFERHAFDETCGRVKHLRRSAQDVSSHPVERTLFEIVAAFFAAFYLEMYLEAIMLFHTGSYSGILDGTNLRFAWI